VTSAAPVLERPLAQAPQPAPASVSRPIWTTDRVVLLAVLGAAIVLAGVIYQQFLGVHRSLWTDGIHDRNAHYLYTLRLATDVRQGRLLRLLVDLDSARVWPPLHGVLSAAVLVVGGLDYRLAVLPSLVAWVGTVVFGFLVARRAVPRGGNLAGLVAVLFIAASPAHRAYATDIMLESTGACLSLAVLYCYLVAIQDRSLWAGRYLGVALTALFVHKYNYWLLTVLALTATTAVTYRGQIAVAVRRIHTRFDWRALAKAETRRPLNYALGIVLLIIASVYAHGDRPFVWGRTSVSLYPPHNITHVAYILVFARLLRWWFTGGSEQIALLPLRARQVAYWHAAPVAVWFLLPKHFGCFLWFLSPANAEIGKTSSLLAGLADYAHWAVNEYHVALWSAVTAATLLVAAMASCQWLRPGGAVVLWLVLFGALLGSSHPNRKARFLHSWLAAGWVAAGAGVAGVTYSGLVIRRSRLRHWFAGASLVALAATHAPALAQRGQALEGGPHDTRPSLLDLTDSYLGDLPPGRRTIVLTTLGIKTLAQWTYLERHGSLDGLEEAWYGFGVAGDQNRQGFLHWLQTTDCNTIVVCEPMPGVPDESDFGERLLHRQMIDLLPSQTVFSPVARRELPQVNAVMTIWRH
jgi:hypothetical protein